MDHKLGGVYVDHVCTVWMQVQRVLLRVVTGRMVVAVDGVVGADNKNRVRIFNGAYILGEAEHEEGVGL